MNLSYLLKLLTVGLFASLILLAFMKTGVKSLAINNQIITVEIANTPKERYQGLSNRVKLCQTCGMLFLFEKKEIQNFVMRNMNFPLDIIWIDNNKIIKIDKELTPEGANPTHKYTSGEKVNKVLEVNGGFCDEYGIKVGDELNL